jgi:hypothetical protein
MNNDIFSHVKNKCFQIKGFQIYTLLLISKVLHEGFEWWRWLEHYGLCPNSICASHQYFFH